MFKRLLVTLSLPATLVACSEAEPPFGSRPVRTPTLFAPGVVSTSAREYGITFAPDGREAYFTRRGRGRQARPRIFVSRFVGGAWAEARPASFSTGWEEAPFLTDEGRRLLYSSRRIVPGWGSAPLDGNLWVVERIDGDWGAPSPLRGDVNRPRFDGERAPARSESGPVLLPDGTLLYWSEEEGVWGNDLYAARQEDGAFVDPRPLRLNTGGSESQAALSPDGRFLIFQSYREARAVGREDLYVAERTAYGWGRPTVLPVPFNSAANDGYPSFSPDGRYFFFASDRDPATRAWSIYYVETDALPLLPG